MIKLAIALIYVILTLVTSASGEDRPRQEYKLYDQQSRYEGVIRETQPNTYQMYDKQSKRTGTIYVHPDGRVEMFAPDGKRIGPRIVPSHPQPTRRTP